MSKQSITILQLYPRDMNIYGDHGNTLVLQRRLQWHGYDTKTLDYNPGDKFPDDVDIIVGGGGQDSGQNKIQADLMSIAPKLKALAESGTPMLMVCGLYQLFGKFFKTSNGEIIQGIGLGNIFTDKRLFLPRQFQHLVFDLLEILGRDRLFAEIYVVIKTVLDVGSDTEF